MSEPDPLDAWTRRTIGAIAAAVGARALYPFDGPPYLPFQRWALRAGGVYPSPVGALIDPTFGLWHAYRGALAFTEKRPLPPPDERQSPCATCQAKPCLTACPVDAFGPDGYNIPACTGHLSGPNGADCLDFGCRARHACPVGQDHRYAPDQARFHMKTFFNAQHRR